MTSLIDPAALSGGLNRSVAVLEKATGAELARVGVAGSGDVRPAVRAARAAQVTWAARPACQRAAVLRAAAAVLAAHATEVADWLVREGGSIRAKADHEVSAALDELWTASSLPTRPQGHLLAAEPGRQSFAERIPLGVVGVISPWNVPLLLALRAVAPALALGNAVVLKPDLNTPVAGGYVIAEVFRRAGLPEGVLQVLPGDGEPGEALTADSDVAMIAFTGSTRVGRRIGAVAGRQLKRTSLELGGNNAYIVLDDADVDAASAAGAWGSFFHQGQICMAAGRHIVHRAVADEYLEKLSKHATELRMGDPWTSDVELGPMVSGRQLARVFSIVRESVDAGAELLTGGRPAGPFFPPTVLGGVRPDMPVFTEEIFGPVAPVVVVDSDAEAVALANRTEYGLTAAIQTASVRRGRAIADQLRTGMVHINDQTINDEAHVPFGGRGASGNGSRHGAEQSWDQYTQWRWLTVRDEPVQYPF